MAKYTKPNLSIQWAQTGTIVAPSDAKKQVGWIEEKPAFEYMNWLQNRQDKALAYSFQMGIPEWDNTTEYQSDTTYASYVQYNGIVYKSILTGSNKNPATETSYWQRAFDNYGAASTVNAALTTHITNYGTLAALSNVATARSNLSVYSKAETDAAYAPYAGNSSQTFLVATATSAGHAVRKSQFDAKTGQADESTAGIMEVATQAETNAGSSDVVAVTPKKLMASNYNPAGVVMAFAGTAAPSGWLECNGSAISRTAYAALFSAIGTTYGIGNGSSTFNIPDLRGEFIRGWDHGKGTDGGRAAGTSQTQSVQDHKHETPIPSGTGTDDLYGPKQGSGPWGAAPGTGASSWQRTDSNAQYNNISGGMYTNPSPVTTGTGETRPRNIAMMYIIKV